MALLTKLGLTPTPTVAKAIAAKAAADALAPPPVKSGDVPAKAPSAGAKAATTPGRAKQPWPPRARSSAGTGRPMPPG